MEPKDQQIHPRLYSHKTKVKQIKQMIQMLHQLERDQIFENISCLIEFNPQIT